MKCTLLLICLLACLCNVATTPNHCYVGKPENYNGTVSVTRGGLTCQRWDSQHPHRHFFYNKPEEFIDGEVPENYCRNILGENLEPWCYTTDPAKRWDYCDVNKCSSWTEGPNGKLYIDLHKAKQNKENSRRLCEDAGGFLPKPENREENDFLKAFTDYNFYIGVNDTNIEGRWVFDDDSSSIQWADWIDWGTGGREPSGRTKGNCVSIWRHKGWTGWVDVQCTYYEKISTVVCEQKKKGVVHLQNGLKMTIDNVYMHTYYTDGTFWDRRADDGSAQTYCGRELWDICDSSEYTQEECGGEVKNKILSKNPMTIGSNVTIRCNSSLIGEFSRVLKIEIGVNNKELATMRNELFQPYVILDKCPRYYASNPQAISYTYVGGREFDGFREFIEPTLSFNTVKQEDIGKYSCRFFYQNSEGQNRTKYFFEYDSSVSRPELEKRGACPPGKKEGENWYVGGCTRCFCDSDGFTKCVKLWCYFELA